MTRWIRTVLGFVFAASAAATALGGDVLSDYQARYQKADYNSVREDLVKEIAATGRIEAVKALQWCQAQAKQALEDAREKADKAQTKLQPARAKYEVVFHQWVENEKKLGRTPDVTHPPSFPEYDAFLQAGADVQNAEKAVLADELLVKATLDLVGDVVTRLSPDAQKVVADDWTKSRLASKDWGVRAELYEILGHTPTPWALDMTVAAVGNEADPRALVAAIDALSGKDAAKVTPTIVSRIDDVRWLVRAAVIMALEQTPSKEGIDAIVKRMQKESGRLLDDCRRALRALTGATMAANPEVWRVWWESNREKWAGKPPAPKEGPIDPLNAKESGPAPEDARKTGFFGLAIESKRVVFVIDVSGSMTWEMGGSGPDAKASRASRAKEELKNCITALGDDVVFDIIFFSAGVHVWKPEMQKADVKSRKEAREYVDAAEVMGGTNTYDALEAAFALGDMGKGKKRESDPTGDARVDTIVFLSDGKPSLGRTTDPDAIRAAVRDWNKSRRIQIHSIAFGVGGTAVKGHEGADPDFMKGLAFDTGGQFVPK